MRKFGHHIVVMILIVLSLVFDIMNNTYIIYLSIGIISISVVANLMVSFICNDNSCDTYPNLIETYKTKKLKKNFKDKGVDVKIYSYTDDKLNASLLPSSHCIIIALSQSLLGIFDEKECISIIYHELGHYAYRQYHIKDFANSLNNVMFLSLCLGLLFLSKLYSGTSVWGIFIIPLLGFLFIELYSMLNKRLFLIEEYYADKYSYLRTGRKDLVEIYNKMILFDNTVNVNYVLKKIENINRIYEK